MVCFCECSHYVGTWTEQISISKRAHTHIRLKQFLDFSQPFLIFFSNLLLFFLGLLKH